MPLALCLLILLCIQMWSTEKTDVTSLFIKHTGESDKAILPLVIYSMKPDEAYLRQVIGADEWEEAFLFQLEGTDMQTIIELLQRYAKKQKLNYTGAAFGTFQLTYLNGKDRIDHVFERKQFIQLIRQFSEALAGKHKDLADRFDSYKARLNIQP